jgi:polar amino acid transport system permease protein
MTKANRQRLRDAVLYALLLGVLVLLAFAADWPVIQENFLNQEVLRTLWPEIITVAAKNTIVYTAISFAGGLVLGVVLALMKLSPVTPYRWLATAWIEFFRGLPALVVIIGFALAVPIAFNWQPPGGLVGAGVLALVIVSSAYMAETIRSGIQAVPPGQVEAAHSLGMSGSWTMVSVVLPQAFRIIIPPLTNEFVLLLKDTSLLAIVGAATDDRELTTFGRDSVSENFNSSPLLAVALLYLVITLPLTRLVAYLEKRSMVKAR